MKKSLFLLASLFVTLLALAQAPASFNYQGMARNSSGQPYASQSMNVRLTIHSGTAAGNIEYAEVRSISTNAFGLFNIQVGSPGANAVQGNFSLISWGTETKFLQTEINLPGNMNYTDLGTVAIQSVPYAIHSKEAAELKMPFEKTISNSGNLFALTNTSNETSSGAAFLNSTVGYGLHAQSESGTAVKAQSSFGTALETDGGLLIHGGNTNPGADKVLTSDAFGNASWKENAPARLKLPFDTTVNMAINEPIFRIVNTAPFAFSPVASFENKKSYAITATSDSASAIAAYSKSPVNPAIFGGNSIGGPGVWGNAYFVPGGTGVKGSAGDGNTAVGVLGEGEFNSIGVKGTSVNYMGVAGVSTNQIGVYANSTNGIAMEAVSTNSFGVYASSSFDHAIIGLSTTSNKAGVLGNSLATGGIGLLGEAFAASSIGVKAKGNAGTTALEVDGPIKIYGVGQFPGAGKVLTSDANGNASWRNPGELKKIGFSARRAVSRVFNDNTWGKVDFPLVDFDGGNNFFHANQIPSSTFKIPVRGLYHFSTQVALKDQFIVAIRGGVRIMYKRNGVTNVMAVRSAWSDPANTSWPQQLSVSLSGDFYFLANDEVWVEFYQRNAVASSMDIAENEICFFTGHLVLEN